MGFVFSNLRDLQKAYTEGVYADTPQNRKLGRVGMSYKEYAEMKEGEVKDLNKLSWKNSPYDSNIEEVKIDKYKKIQRYKDGDLEVYSIHDENNDLYEVTKDEVLDFYNGKKNISEIRKNKKIEEENKENEKRQIEVDKIYSLVNDSILSNLKQSQLDAIIEYSNSAKEEGVEGIEISKDAKNQDKRLAIAKFYREAAEDDIDNLNEILQDALEDYTPKSKINEEIKELETEYEDIMSKYLDYDKYFESKEPKKENLEEFYIKQEDAFNKKADKETKEKVDNILRKIKDKKYILSKK